MKKNQFGIMLGRLFPESTTKYNIFPKKWRNEFISSKKIGFNYIEFLFDEDLSKINPIHSHNFKKILNNSIKTKQKTYSIVINFFAKKNFFSDIKFSKKIIKNVIYACKKINIKMIVFPLLEKSSVDKEKLNQFLKIMYEEIKNTNLFCAVEMDNKTNLNDKKRLFSKYFPKIGICYDTGNSISDNTKFDHEIIKLGKLINHVHLKDKIRIKKKYFNTYLGEGKLNFNKLKYALNKIKYRKKITFECYYGSSPLSDAKKNIGYAYKNLL